MLSEEHWKSLLVGLGAYWLWQRCPWLVDTSLPWQGYGVNSRWVRGLCLNPRTCVPLSSWDQGLGYVLELRFHCPKASLPHSMAQPTCVHTCVCVHMFV